MLKFFRNVSIKRDPKKHRSSIASVFYLRITPASRIAFERALELLERLRCSKETQDESRLLRSCEYSFLSAMMDAAESQKNQCRLYAENAFLPSRIIMETVKLLLRIFFLHFVSARGWYSFCVKECKRQFFSVGQVCQLEHHLGNWMNFGGITCRFGVHNASSSCLEVDIWMLSSQSNGMMEKGFDPTVAAISARTDPRAQRFSDPMLCKFKC